MPVAVWPVDFAPRGAKSEVGPWAGPQHKENPEPCRVVSWVSWVVYWPEHGVVSWVSCLPSARRTAKAGLLLDPGHSRCTRAALRCCEVAQ